MDLMAGQEDGVLQKQYVHSVLDVNKEVMEFCFEPRSSMINSLALSKPKDGVKMTASTYIAFLKKHFVPWYKMKSLASRCFHAGQCSFTCCAFDNRFFEVFRQNGEIMEWPVCSPDLNPIENLYRALSKGRYMLVESSTRGKSIFGMRIKLLPIVFHLIKLRN